MRFAVLAAVLLVGASAEASPAVQTVSGWVVTQVTPGGGGCSAKQSGDQVDTFVAFAKGNDGDLMLIAAWPEWRLGSDRFVSAHLAVDAAEALPIDVYLKSNLAIYLPIDAAIEHKLLEAKTLRWHFPWGDFTAEVTGISDAAEAVCQCNRQP